MVLYWVPELVHTHETAAYYGTAGIVPVAKQDFLEAAWKPYPHPETGKYHQDGYMFDYPAYCSICWGWQRAGFGMSLLHRNYSLKNEEGINAYAQLDQLAESGSCRVGWIHFLPYLQGRRSPEFNPWATGVFFGLKKPHQTRAFIPCNLESFGFMIRHGLDTFYPQGHPVKRLVATGAGPEAHCGARQSAILLVIRQEYVPEADAPLGAAYVAGLALGYFKNFDSLQKEWVHVTTITEPNLEAQQIYNE